MEERTDQQSTDTIIDDNPFRKGCNPSYSTARSKLQKKRRRINDDIIKELRLRKGAENLLRASSNKEVKEKVLIELGFVNSKLEVLRGDLAELNSSVKTYQNENSEGSVPMITLGLKETKDANFQTVIMDYIEEHYSESGINYEENIKNLHSLRKAIRTPDRSLAGIELLLSYYNQLGYIEKRFYPPGRTVPVYFSWYDSLTGVCIMQRTLGYEKGSVLFNIGALYSQIATAQDRSTVSGLGSAVEYYQKSAGILKYLRDRFTHAPSLDMNTETLTLLMQLMLSQAQECVYERLILSHGKPQKFTDHVKYSQEAAMVSQMYEETHNAVASKAIRNDVPASWLTMTIMKCNHYKAMAHFYLASALMLSKELLPSHDEIAETLSAITTQENNNSSSQRVSFTKDKLKRNQYCRAHLNQAVSLNETAEKDYSFCRTLRSNDDVFMKVLSEAQTCAKLMLIEVGDDKDYEDIFMSAPQVIPLTQTLVQIDLISFTDLKVEDFFKELGPLTVFSARSEWTAPRTFSLNKDDSQGFGFTIKGENPSTIVEIEPNSPAHVAGLKTNDILVMVNGVNVKNKPQKDIKVLILERVPVLEIAVVTPMPPSVSPSMLIPKHDDTMRSSMSSGSGDMQQMDTMTGTWKNKMKNLTFLKNKKAAPKGSLRNK